MECNGRTNRLHSPGFLLNPLNWRGNLSEGHVARWRDQRKDGNL